MNDFPCSIYEGEFFDDNTNVIVPRDSSHTAAFFAYIRSGKFNKDLRVLNQKATSPKNWFHRFRSTSNVGNKLPPSNTQWPSRTAQRRPYPMALQGPSKRFDRPAPGRSGPSNGVPLARSGSLTTSTYWPTPTALSPFPPCGASLPPLSDCARLLQVAFGSEWSASVQDKLLDRGRGQAGHVA